MPKANSLFEAVFLEHDMWLSRHPSRIRAMHAITGLLIVAMLISGLVMVRMDDANPWKYERLYIWHQSFGIVALVLINLRLLVRLRTNLQPLPASMGKNIRRIAHSVYILMNGLMLTVPAAGLIMSAAYPEGQGLVFFNAVIPSFLLPDNATFQLAKSIHWILAYAFAGLIGLHGAAALRHRFFDTPEHNVLKRMF